MTSTILSELANSLRFVSAPGASATHRCRRTARLLEANVPVEIFHLPRQITMYIARQVTGASLEEIGREFVGRHHTTVLHAINKIERMRRTDDALNRTITRLVEAVVARTWGLAGSVSF